MAQFLTLTHGVDDKVARIDDEVQGVDAKVEDIGDTVEAVHEGAQHVKLSYSTLYKIYAARWKGNESDCAAYCKQRQRGDGCVVQ